MEKRYYCPFCAHIQDNVGTKICERCHRLTEMIELKYNISYYRELSNNQFCGRVTALQLMRMEAEANPQFDKELDEKLSQKSKKKLDEFYANMSKLSPNPNVPKCPTCGSTNISKISNLRRGIHGATFGLFSKTARSQFECKNCGYKW